MAAGARTEFGQGCDRIRTSDHLSVGAAAFDGPACAERLPIVLGVAESAQVEVIDAGGGEPVAQSGLTEAGSAADSVEADGVDGGVEHGGECGDGEQSRAGGAFLLQAGEGHRRDAGCVGEGLTGQPVFPT